MRRLLVLVTAVAVLVAMGLPATGFVPTSSFADGFEGTEIDPFWDVVEQNGTVSLSTDQAHSDAQSLRMHSERGTQQRTTLVRHVSPLLLKGTVSVWFYDTGSRLSSFLGLYNDQLDSSDPAYSFGIGTKHYDSSYYYYSVAGQNLRVARRTTGWHHFIHVLDDQGVTGFLDGQQVGFVAGDFAFDRIVLASAGPWYRADATFYFDDFSLEAYPANLIEVAIDVKPGTDDNCVNSNGHGVIPVAVLSSAEFDATTVNPATVDLDGQQVHSVGKKGKLQAHLDDVNGDGLTDLMVQIENVAGTYDDTSTTALLSGATFGGVPIQGTDSICVVPPTS